MYVCLCFGLSMSVITNCYCVLYVIQMCVLCILYVVNHSNIGVLYVVNHSNISVLSFKLCGLYVNVSFK